MSGPNHNWIKWFHIYFKPTRTTHLKSPRVARFPIDIRKGSLSDWSILSFWTRNMSPLSDSLIKCGVFRHHLASLILQVTAWTIRLLTVPRRVTGAIIQDLTRSTRSMGIKAVQPQPLRLARGTVEDDMEQPYSLQASQWEGLINSMGAVHR